MGSDRIPLIPDKFVMLRIAEAGRCHTYHNAVFVAALLLKVRYTGSHLSVRDGISRCSHLGPLDAPAPYLLFIKGEALVAGSTA